MVDYGVCLRDIISLLDPYEGLATASPVPSSSRRKRQVKIYKHPETVEVVETKGGNYKVLKAWKETHGANIVEGWMQ